MFKTENEYLYIIDELAANDFVVVNDFLPNDIFESIKVHFDECVEAEKFEKAGIGAFADNTIKSEIRGDYTFWLDKKKDIKIKGYFEMADELMAIINRYCYLSLKDYEFHLAQYPIGSFYKKHLDQFKSRNNRMITIIIYLNEAWSDGDGGELNMYLVDKELKIPPIANRCVLFKSDTILHEVLPTNIIRKSLTGWFLHKPKVVGAILG